MDGDDVRVVQGARDTGFAEEALDDLGPGGVKRRELLQSDEAAQVSLAGDVDDGRAAAPHLAEELVPSDHPQDRFFVDRGGHCRPLGKKGPSQDTPRLGGREDPPARARGEQST